MNQDNTGCLGSILGFIIVVGNLFLFTGALNDDLSDNSIAWFMVIVAIVADIAMVIWLLSEWAKSVERKNEQQRLAELAEIERKKVAELATIEGAIQKFWSTYAPKKNEFVSGTNLIIYPQNDTGNIEIINCVKHYKESNEKLYNELRQLNDKVFQILNKSKQFSEKSESLEFLNNSREQLNLLKTETDSIELKLSQKKIYLNNESYDGVRALKNAFALIKYSKKTKCNSKIHPLDETYEKCKPHDLEMFEYDFSPLTLRFEKSTLCFFEKCILVFDENGVFRTALDPSSLSISITRNLCDVWFFDNETNNLYVDTDSKCVIKGEEFTTWAHTRADGSRDLRYSYNPLITCRKDLMQYGIIEFNQVIYTVSSAAAIDAMEKAEELYCKSFQQHHDPIPSLINLLEVLVPDNAPFISKAKSEYSSRTKNGGYFCKIIGGN